MKENTIGQTMYEKLQKFLEVCCVLGFDYKSVDRGRNFKCNKDGIGNGMSYEDYEEMSYHELFSRESGLLEFITRKNEKYTAEEIQEKIKNNFFYMVMGPMTTDSKIQFILEYSTPPSI